MSQSHRCTETPQLQLLKNTTFGTYSRSNRRYTPFGKTPKSRKLVISSAGRQILRTPGPNKQAVDLKGLTGKTWRVHRLTPMYKFNSNNREQKRYASMLSAYIEAENKKSTIIEDDIPGRAIFSWYKDIKVSAADEEALQIIIKGSSRNGNGPDVPVLTAILLCVDLDENPIDKEIREHFTYYPIMLVKGPVRVTDMLATWLMKQFDCRVSQATYTSLELACIVAMWSGLCTKPIKKSKQVELVYKVPAECKGMNKITYSVCAEDCKDLWDSIHSTESEEFTELETQMFIRSIENHFYYYSKVRLSAMQLSRVGTPVMMLGSEGRLKIFSSEHALVILRHFTELSVERFVP